MPPAKSALLAQNERAWYILTDSPRKYPRCDKCAHLRNPAAERVGVDAVQGGSDGRADARDGRRCRATAHLERHARSPQEGGQHRQRSPRL